MTLQTTGSISLGQIASEFGKTSSISLGSFRQPDSTYGGVTLPTFDSGIPTSGPISLGNFYGKKKTIIIDYYTGTTETNVNARNRFVNSNTTAFVSGGGIKPSTSSGSKVYIIVNKTLGDASRNYGIRTGSWDSNTELNFIVSGSGAIYGAGGAGGAGGNGSGAGSPGQAGTPAIYIEYPANIINNGYIQCGYGGGGGGGGAFDDPDKNPADPVNTGGGGGGGAGFNAGAGGAGGTGAAGGGCNGYPGSPANTTNGGAGGGGRSCRVAGSSYSGSGGVGGGVSTNPAPGGGGSGNKSSGAGGSAGASGRSILRDPAATIIGYSGTGTVRGKFIYKSAGSISSATQFDFVGGTIGRRSDGFCPKATTGTACCGIPFNPFTVEKVIVTGGGSGKNLSFDVSKTYYYTRGLSRTNLTCDYNVRYNFTLNDGGFGYNAGEVVTLSFDSRQFQFTIGSIVN